jgi:exopolyphosphatase/guanosine-5'-triphosphate,3'-diphosphate pyrophosphatase
MDENLADRIDDLKSKWEQTLYEPVVGALDLGSNSFHFLVVRVRKDRSFQELYSEKVMLRLGEEVARHGCFLPQSIERAVEVVAGFVKAATLVGCQDIVAYATAAFREAENASDLVDAIQERCHVTVHVISGHREAELIFRAVRASISLGLSPALVADLGGGSLELALGDQGQMYFAVSLRLGVGRLISRFTQSDPMTAKEIGAVESYINTHLRPVLDRAAAYLPRKLVVCSGTFSALVRISYLHSRGVDPLLLGKDLNGMTLEADDLFNLGKLVLSKSSAERLKIPGIDPKRNDQLPIGYLVLKTVLRYLDVQRVEVSDWALREGMILDYVDSLADFDFTFDEGSLRIGSLVAFLDKFGGYNDHARQVRKLSREIALSLSHSLDITRSEIELLEFAAMVHDVGAFISSRHHDRHSAYLVEAASLRGFTLEEQRMLAALCRFHKKGSIKIEDYPLLETLPPAQIDRLAYLVAILRTADALDRSHQSLVQSCSVSVGDSKVLIEIEALGDVTLELYGLRKKGRALEEVLSKALEVKVR